jgi:hypothetical protein
MDRSPTIGQPLQLNISVPTRFKGTADLSVRLKCEAKDTRLFNLSEENPNAVLVKQDCLLAQSKPVTKDGEITGTVELIVPDHAPPSTPVDSRERTHMVWSLILTAEGSGRRKCETQYILSVVNAQS